MILHGHFAGKKNKVKDKAKRTRKKTVKNTSVKRRPRPRKVEWPSKNELESLIKNSNFSTIGRMFGVSDNAVRKWAKHYKIL